MAAPPSLNLIGEILLLTTILSFRSYFLFFIVLISFFGGVYSIYLYVFTNHGKFYSGCYSYNSGVVREYLLLFLH